MHLMEHSTSLGLILLAVEPILSLHIQIPKK